MKVWREREGGELSVVLCSDRLSCVASLQHFTALAVPETDPPSLPPSLPSLISPPRFASCHLSSPLLLSSLHLLSFFPVHSSLVFLLKPSSLSPLPIPYIHPSSHRCNVLFRSAFLPYEASKVTLSRGVCVLHCCGYARMHMCMYQFMFACLPLLKYMCIFVVIVSIYLPEACHIKAPYYCHCPRHTPEPRMTSNIKQWIAREHVDVSMAMYVCMCESCIDQASIMSAGLLKKTGGTKQEVSTGKKRGYFYYFGIYHVRFICGVFFFFFLNRDA